MSKTEKEIKKEPRNPQGLRLERVKQIQILARKLKHTSATFQEGSYWEQIEEDCEKILSRPLG